MKSFYIKLLFKIFAVISGFIILHNVLANNPISVSPTPASFSSQIFAADTVFGDYLISAPEGMEIFIKNNTWAPSISQVTGFFGSCGLSNASFTMPSSGSCTLRLKLHAPPESGTLSFLIKVGAYGNPLSFIEFPVSIQVIPVIPVIISASGGPGGTISPNGSLALNYGDNQTFIITPSVGHTISDVVVDGVSQGAISTYTFNNVTESHFIVASFALQQFTIIASTGIGGSIFPNGSVTVNYGDNPTFNIVPAGGYRIFDVLVDGSSIGTPTSYTFPSVTTSHTISASFEQQHTLVAVAGPGGTITPSGNIIVDDGANQTFNIAANTGFYITDVVVDGISQGTPSSFPFINITQDHTIFATFSSLPTVTSVNPASGYQGGGTAVTINGTNFACGSTTVQFGSNLATNVTVINSTQLTATSPSGFGVVDVTVTTPGGTSLTSPLDQYTYLPALTFTVAPTYPIATFSGAALPNITYTIKNNTTSTVTGISRLLINYNIIPLTIASGCGATLAANATCNLNLHIDTTPPNNRIIGDYKQILDVSYTDPATSSATKLTDSNPEVLIQPVATLSPIIFTEVPEYPVIGISGSTAQSLQYTVKNNSATTAFTISSVSTELSKPITISSDNCSGQNLAIGQTCSITLQYTPPPGVTQETDIKQTLNVIYTFGDTNNLRDVRLESITYPQGLIFTEMPSYSWPVGAGDAGYPKLIRQYIVQNPSTAISSVTFNNIAIANANSRVVIDPSHTTCLNGMTLASMTLLPGAACIIGLDASTTLPQATGRMDIYNGAISLLSDNLINIPLLGNFLFASGSSGTGDGQFTTPQGIAATTDISNNLFIYVADTGNNRIQVFDNTGAYKTKWGSLGALQGQFNQPASIAAVTDIIGDTYVYVADTNNNRIQVFKKITDTIYSFYITWNISAPTGIYALKDNSGTISIYVANTSGISIYTDNGILVTQWNDTPSGTLVPRGVAAASDSGGNIFIYAVSNSGFPHAVVYKSDSVTGHYYVVQWGNTGTGVGQFNVINAASAITDINGNILVYLPDRGNNRIQVFKDGGTYVTRWGSAGAGNGQFNHPQGVATATDNSGNTFVYVADTDNNRIQAFSGS